jgi:hypothetical protein
LGYTLVYACVSAVKVMFQTLHILPLALHPPSL